MTEDGPSGVWAGFTDIAALGDAITKSLADGVPVVLPGYELVVISDVLMLELLANGVGPLGGYLVLRQDGRSARTVRNPDHLPEGGPDA